MPRLDQFITLYLYTPLVRFAGRTRNGFVPILKYHSISSNLFGQSHPYFQINTQPEIFSKQMRWLKSQGYQGIHLSEMFDGLASGLDMSNRVVITFDDGYRDFFTEGFAILKQCGFKATVFLVTDRIRKTPVRNEGVDYLTWNDVRQLIRRKSSNKRLAKRLNRFPIRSHFPRRTAISPDSSVTRWKIKASRTASPALSAGRIAGANDFHCRACRLIPGTRQECCKQN